MRLLESRTLNFKEFYDEETMPKYAILSHTWEDDEVSFKEMDENREKAWSKAGFKKIYWCAKQALVDELEFIWVDTCCIDKSSSAELSEAINSMFRWYKNSEVCYAYLSDVEAWVEDASDAQSDDAKHFFRNEEVESKDGPKARVGHEDPRFFSNNSQWEEPSLFLKEQFTNARWFTRGWTLQELIAPSKLIFYDKNWVIIGFKPTPKISELIERCTGIPQFALISGDLSRYPVARRMSWAASRSTTRIEDMSYCLMGLFDIHMPMLYGEGKRAFIRLQEEIIKQSDDMSIFVWTDSMAKFSSHRGLLARTPSDFEDCKNIWWSYVEESPNSEINSKGVKLNDVCLKPRKDMLNEFILSFPGVRDNSNLSGTWAGIYVKKTSRDHFVRVDSDQVEAIWWSETERYSQYSSIFIRQRPMLADDSRSRIGAIILNDGGLEPGRLRAVTPRESWDEKSKRFLFNTSEQLRINPRVQFSIQFSNEKTNITLDASKDLVSCIDAEGRLEMIRGSNTTSRASFRYEGPSVPVFWVIVMRKLVDDDLVLELQLIS